MPLQQTLFNRETQAEKSAPQLGHTAFPGVIVTAKKETRGKGEIKRG